ncbi:MAG: hypothetical protein NVS2B12_40500 [Ktedonobacteraceae bacterium]
MSSDGPQAWPTGAVVRLEAGAIGTVVMVYTNDSVAYEYEVEFFDADGNTRALLMLKQDELELV